jgi:hypothetical protein
VSPDGRGLCAPESGSRAVAGPRLARHLPQRGIPTPRGGPCSRPRPGPVHPSFLPRARCPNSLRLTLIPVRGPPQQQGRSCELPRRERGCVQQGCLTGDPATPLSCGRTVPRSGSQRFEARRVCEAAPECRAFQSPVPVPLGRARPDGPEAPARPAPGEASSRGSDRNPRVDEELVAPTIRSLAHGWTIDLRARLMFLHQEEVHPSSGARIRAGVRGRQKKAP